MRRSTQPIAVRLDMSNDRRPSNAYAFGPAIVFAVSLLYFLAFSDYGFHREDEGALLMQFWLWASGEVPHRDFHLGYTPGVFFLHKTLMQLVGPGVLPVRWLLALVNSVSAALLFLAAARVTSSWKWALVAPLLFVAAVPVYTGEFAAFNIPYPVWYCVLFFCGTAIAAPALLRAPTAARLLACGALAGLGFTFKPNVGLFQLAATALVCLLACGRPRTAFERISWWTWWAAILGGLAIVFANAASTADILWFLAPAFAVAVAVARDAHAAPAREHGASPAQCAALVGAGFFAVCLPWLAWSWSILGPDWFARRALFLGAGFESFYSLPGPASVLGLAAIVVAAAAWLLPAWLLRYPIWILPPVAAVAASLGFVALALTRPMPQGLHASVMSVVEPRFYTAAALVQWMVIAIWLLRPEVVAFRRARGDDLRPVFVCGVLLYLQLFPRIDLMHWMTAAPLLFPAAAWLLAAIARRWSPSASIGRRRLVGAGVALPVVAVAVLRLANHLDARWDWSGSGFARTPETTLAIPHAPLAINAGRAESFRELEAAVSFITRATAVDDPVFTFPALDYVSYFALRKPGNRHGYYFPGWPGHDAEAEVLVSLVRRPPKLAVTLYENQLYFGSAFAYYFLFDDFIESSYRRVARLGPYAFFAPSADDAEPAEAGPARVAPDAIAVALGDDRRNALEADLGSTDPADRIAAARRMGEWSILGDFEPLRRALVDDEPLVRSAAVKAVPGTRSPAVRDVLLAGVAAKSFSTADSVLAVRASNLACDASCVAPLLALTEGHAPEVARAARGLLGELPVGRWQRDFWWEWEGEGTGAFAEPALSKLRHALEHADADPEHRILAYAFADRLGLGDCPATLDRWARGHPREVGPDFTVCTALHHLSRAGCRGPWLESSLAWMGLDPVVSVRTALREARRGGAGADALLAAEVDARRGVSSAMASWICGVAGGDECLAAARRTLEADASEQERIAAAWAWSQLEGDDEGFDALRAIAARDASPQVRETAAYGIELKRLRAGGS